MTRPRKKKRTEIKLRRRTSKEREVYYIQKIAELQGRPATSEAMRFVEEVAEMDLTQHWGTGTDKLIRKARRIRKKFMEKVQ